MKSIAAIYCFDVLLRDVDISDVYYKDKIEKRIKISNLG